MHNARVFLTMVVWLTFVLCSAAGAQLVVVRGPEPAADRMERLLQFGGIAFRQLAPREVTAEALTGARTVVLLHAPLTPEGTAALARFAAGGGKLVLVGQEGAAELHQAVGAEAAPARPPTRSDRIERVVEEAAVPGMPAMVRDAATPSLSLTPLPGTRVLARRTSATSEEAPGHPTVPMPTDRLAGTRSDMGEAAITLAPGGAAFDALFAPGDRREKSWLLQAVLAAVDPALAEPVARALRRQAADALDSATSHWTRVRDSSLLPQARRLEALRMLQALRAAWADLRLGAARPAMTDAAPLQAFIQRVRTFDLGLTSSPPAEIRGVWIHTYAPTDWDRVAQRVKAAGFNSLFARVGRGGNVIYPSAFLPRDAWAEKAGGDELQRAIEATHRHGLQFCAWRVNFHMGSAPKVYRDRMAAEDRLVRDSHGVQADWANPGDPRNQELEFQVMRELVQKYDIDGLQFDYIRYPDAPSYDYDYGPVSRREFERKLGKPVANWPADVLSGPLKTQYEDWERENINHLVARVYGEVKRLKPWVQVSAAVWRNHRRYRAVLKQDWPLWVERGWLDFVVPMDYTPEMETFAATVDAQVALTRGRVPLAAGIGSWLLDTPEELARQVEIAREAGAAGFVLFAYNAEQIEEQLAGLHLGATASDARVPLPAPPIRVALASPALSLKDAPLAVLAGSRLQVGVTREPHGGGERGKVSQLFENAKTRNGETSKGTAKTLYKETRKPGGRIPEFLASSSSFGISRFRSFAFSRSQTVGQPGCATTPASWQVRLERPTGELIQVVGQAGPNREVMLSGVAPEGRFQPVVRGVLRLAEGERPFVARGPVVEGLSADEVAALRAQEQPPNFPPWHGDPNVPRVAIYMGGLGAETLLKALATQPEARVAAVYRLRPEHLAAVDTLVLPQLADVAELDGATQARLRHWVEGGKMLILTHDAIGARWHPRLFPEVCRDAELAPATAVQTESAIGSVPAATVFHHGGSDQFRITPGPAGHVLAREVLGIGDGPSAARGAPVIVAGRVGRGTVVLVGFLSGYLETQLSPDEARLLAALARYRPAGDG